MEKHKLTVGEVLEMTRKLPEDMEVTFGSSRSSLRPLIFYRFKRRGERSLQIELNELTDSGSEIDSRITIKELREGLALFGEDYQLSFGATTDAVELFARDPKVVLSFQIDQSPEQD